MLAIVPFGMFAQNAQDVYAVNDDVFNMSYADVSNTFTADKMENKDVPISATNTVYVSDADLLEVDDLLLADADFDIQEDMITYTKDQKTVYFSANKKIKIKKENEAAIKIKKSVQLQMFKAEVTESGEWVNLEMLPFNGKSHSTGYPALNGDETKLYFVSDGPESTGKTDLFISGI